MLGSIFNTKLQMISEVLHHPPCHFLQDRGDRLSLVAFSSVDQWSLDDADTYCPLSRVSNCRSQINVSVPFYFTTWRHKLASKVARYRSSWFFIRGNSKGKVRRRRPRAVYQLKTANNCRGLARNYEESNVELHTTSAIVLWKWRPTLNINIKFSYQNIH